MPSALPSISAARAPWVCLVDGYSTGAALARLLRGDGWRVAHVQSSPRIPLPYAPSFAPEQFDAAFVLEDPLTGATGETGTSSVDALAARLRELGPVAVIAGSEPGVAVSELMAARLGLAGNDPASSARRRDKGAMAEALVAAGIPAVRQHRVSSLAAATAAAEAVGGYPVVLKPLDAGGSEDVRVCADAAELAEAFAATHGKRNVLGSVNEHVLVQELLRGEQYMVNAVSLGGRHLISEVWQERRIQLPGTGILYDREILLPSRGPAQRLLLAYTRRVLDAVGIRDGPSHSELILTERGPILLETAARMQGGIDSDAVAAALGYSHLTLTRERYLEPEAFTARLDAADAAGGEYELARTAMIVNLIAARAGTVRANRTAELLGTLPSFHCIARSPAPGSRIPRTVDLLTKCGHIYLLHADPDQLETDYAQIRAWEQNEELIVMEDE